MYFLWIPNSETLFSHGMVIENDVFALSRNRYKKLENINQICFKKQQKITLKWSLKFTRFSASLFDEKYHQNGYKMELILDIFRSFFKCWNGEASRNTPRQPSLPIFLLPWTISTLPRTILTLPRTILMPPLPFWPCPGLFWPSPKPFRPCPVPFWPCLGPFWFHCGSIRNALDRPIPHSFKLVRRNARSVWIIWII